MDCKFCHNHGLIDGKKTPTIPMEKIVNIIEENGFIDAVSLCGGEPSLHSGLENFITELKKQVKDRTGTSLYINLDTNGLITKAIKKLIPAVDKFSIDFKGMDECIETVLRPRSRVDKYVIRVSTTIAVVRSSGKDLEVRITYSPSWISERNLEAMGKILHDLGVEKVILQKFSNQNVRKEAMDFNVPTEKEMEKAISIMERYGLKCKKR